MTSIGDVSYGDIKQFLSNNGIKWSINDNENYQTVLKMIRAGQGENYPDSLIDWIIAYNFIVDRKTISNYNLKEIDLLSKEGLKILAEKLGIFESNNLKQSVINVLNYLHKLDDKVILSAVPNRNAKAIIPKQPEVVRKFSTINKNDFIHPDVDKYILSLMQDIDKQKILSSSYDEIIEMFKNDKSLRKIIYDNMREIIRINSYNDEYSDYNTNMSYFIIDLMNIKEIALVKEALKITNEVLPEKDYRREFIGEINISGTNTELMTTYFNLLPYIRTLFPDEAYSDNEIIDIFVNSAAGISEKYYQEHLLPFFEAAIKSKNNFIVDWIIGIWEDEKQFYSKPEDQPFADKMNTLVKEAKEI